MCICECLPFVDIDRANRLTGEQISVVQRTKTAKMIPNLVCMSCVFCSEFAFLFLFVVSFMTLSDDFECFGAMVDLSYRQKIENKYMLLAARQACFACKREAGVLCMQA